MCGVKWIDLKSAASLPLTTNLTCGQSFRWRSITDSSLIGIFEHRVWQLKNSKDAISYRVLACPHWKCFDSSDLIFKALPKRRKMIKKSETTERNCRNCKCPSSEKQLITNYLQLDVDLKKLNSAWIKKDRKFEELSNSLRQIRVLKQDPTETLFSFLCSVNNSISRIVPMIEKMCQRYGDKFLDIGPHSFYDFPSLNTLANSATESELRKLGFGYRASSIIACAKQVLQNGGEEWMMSLRDETYEEAVSVLVKLPGVGMKVADCVCLMSLNKIEAVPIDTHIRQIAVRDYRYQMKTKSLTNNAYKEIGSFFRSLWGTHAGWAQAVLFVADTKELPDLYKLNLDVESRLMT